MASLRLRADKTVAAIGSMAYVPGRLQMTAID